MSNTNRIKQKNTIVIIDDEPDARALIAAYVHLYFPEMEVIGEADGVETGKKVIEELQPYVVFIDIQMGDGTGFDLLNQFERPDFHIIFATAFDDFALKAFKYNALDYLLKPITPEDFKKAMKKVLSLNRQDSFYEQLQQLMKHVKNKDDERIALTAAEGLILVKTKDIRRIEGDGNYCTIYQMNGERIVVTKSMKEFEEMLSPTQFSRSHQSHIVNLECVKKVLKEDGGYLLLDNGDKIMISRRKKEEVISRFAL
jgi:two-component system, LytTR family, response regulator